ncbi:MAG TPA: hypothetical protein VGQ12_02000 [Candidatus Angelobacter sp.]|jgi:hypothetical protein|nr:hypothetical protein [Candidatus Angelobacter sp.]
MRADFRGRLEEEAAFTTYISSDIEALYKSDFLSKQKQTPISSSGELGRELGGLGDTWLSMTPRMGEEHRAASYIIRYYEEKILQLQQELARYKELFARIEVAASEEEGTYLQAAPAAPSDPLKSKLLVATEEQPNVYGFEI